MDEAVAELGLARRTVQEWAKKGILEWRLQTGGTRGRVFSARQIEQLREHGPPPRPRKQREPGEALTRKPPQTAELPLGSWTVIVDALREAVSVMRAPKLLAPAEKLWLSIEEAADYSGLAKSDLLELCRVSEIHGMPLAVRRSGGWRIQRASLEAFGSLRR